MTGKGFRAHWVLELLDGSVSKTAMVDLRCFQDESKQCILHVYSAANPMHNTFKAS